MKTALIYDWLVTVAGGEKTLQAVYELFPSPIFTLLHDKKALKGTLWDQTKIVTSSLQKLPFASKIFRHCLPIFPRMIEQFDLKDYDIVLSCSHSVAKGALTHASQMHICYCYTPMRYAWDLYWEYLKNLSGVKKRAAKWALHRLREWDFISAQRVDHFIAISSHVARRIRKTYGREAAVIYPPVATHLIKAEENKEEFFLTASRLVSYKKVDLIVDAFGAMPDKKLVVVGEGPEMKSVKKKAKRNVEILDYQEENVLRELMGKAKALVFAAEEDFGITPVEAQAAGTPVIAFGRGGALETVIHEITGVFFNEQTVNGIVNAVKEFERITFNPYFISEHAQKFNEMHFKSAFKKFVNEKWEAFCEDCNFSRR